MKHPDVAPARDVEGLLISAALKSPDEAARAWQSWRSSVTVDDSPHHVHALLPQVAANLDVGVLGSDAAILQGLRRRAWAVNERLRALLPAAMATLAAAGADPVPIRGSAFLAARAAPRITRPVDRLDISVAPSRWRTAIDALCGAGWRIAEPRSRSDSGLLLEDGERNRALVTWAPAFPTLLRHPIPDAAPADRIVLAVLDGYRPGAPLTWPLDVSLLAGTARWDDVVVAAARAQVSTIVGDALRRLRDVAALSVPDEVTGELAKGPADGVLVRRARQYAEGHARPDQVRRRLDIWREARRHGVDISYGAPARVRPRSAG